MSCSSASTSPQTPTSDVARAPPAAAALAPFWVVWVLGGVGVLGHLPSLFNQYTTDDFELLVNNPYVRQWGGLKALLTWELFNATGSPRPIPYWRPLSGLLNWVSYQLLGAEAFGQHAFNLVLYGVVAALLAQLLRSLRYSAPGCSSMRDGSKSPSRFAVRSSESSRRPIGRDSASQRRTCSGATSSPRCPICDSMPTTFLVRRRCAIPC